MQGTIKKLVKDRGFGFIGAEDGREFFFHMSAVTGTKFDALQEGQAVTFEIETTGYPSKGKALRASKVAVKA